MSLWSLFSAVVFAAELVISPIPPDGDAVIQKPITTFGMLSGAVLSESTIATESAEMTPAPSPTVTPSPTKKTHYTIAVLGDSMVDTLGPGVPHLQAKLDNMFPDTNFTILNYGVGATNIEYGLERITRDYTYLDKHIPSLVSQLPDIVVVESFGYNPFPFDEGALDRHWLALGTIVDTLKTQIPGVTIVIAATVAPDANTFGDGAPGIAFDQQTKNHQTSKIKTYIQAAINFATSQKYPLADAFTPSLSADGNGNATYINQGDHIHPSDAGKALFADKIAAALIDNGLLE